MTVIPHAADAQAWQDDLHVCEMAGDEDALSLALAIELEGEPTPDAPIRVEVGWPCEADAAVVVVEWLDPHVRVERTVSLTESEPHLRPRVVALVARDLVDAARRLATGESATAEVDHESSPDTEPTERLPAGSLVASPSPSRGPEAVTASALETSPTGLVDLGALSGARMFVLDEDGLIGGGQLIWRWDFLAGFVSVEGMHFESPFASVDVVIATAAFGVVPLRLEERALSASAGIYAEGGVIVSASSTRVRGLVGRTVASPLLGGVVRIQAGYRPGPDLKLLLAVDMGVHFGAEVIAATETLARLDGLSVGVRLGAAFRD